MRSDAEFLDGERVAAARETVADSLPGLTRPGVGPDACIAERRHRGVIEHDGPVQAVNAEGKMVEHGRARLLRKARRGCGAAGRILCQARPSKSAVER
jgi:hypothetical protein